MDSDRSRTSVAMVVDPDALRLRQIVDALAPQRVIDAISLHEAFSLVEEIRPGQLAISDRSAAEPGFDMFLKLAGAIGARFVIYGQTAPPGVPTGAHWVQLPPDHDPSVVAEVLTGRSKAGQMPAAQGARPELILIGASTGGVSAIETVLSQFSAECPPTMVVQHIRASFLESLLSRLNRCCKPHVVAARDGALPARGTVHIAATPECHLVLTGMARPRMGIVPAAPGDLHRPSVDALFRSAAAFGARVSAALLTGMGADGALGLAEIRAAGGFTVAQDRETSTVYGMPRIAAEMGAAAAVLPLHQIGEALLAGQVPMVGDARMRRTAR